MLYDIILLILNWYIKPQYTHNIFRLYTRELKKKEAISTVEMR